MNESWSLNHCWLYSYGCEFIDTVLEPATSNNADSSDNTGIVIETASSILLDPKYTKFPKLCRLEQVKEGRNTDWAQSLL